MLIGFGSLNEDDASDANAVRSDYGRRSPSSEPHPLGAADAQPIERARQSSELVDAGLLRPARECGRDHYRGDVSDPDGVGYPHTPGVWSQEQVDGWRHITEAVHAAGGRILMQLWHVGRISDPSYHDGRFRSRQARSPRKAA